jgi:hypothetical protein
MQGEEEQGGGRRKEKEDGSFTTYGKCQKKSFELHFHLPIEGESREKEKTTSFPALVGYVQ